MGQAIPFTKSIALRQKAAEAIRHARQLPVGPDRDRQRRIARAFKSLAVTEAWLSGERAWVRRAHMTRLES